MRLIEASPITNKVAKDSLTYFSSKDIRVGDIISVDIRKKTYDALAVAVDDIRKRKVDVKASDFSLRKVREKRGAAPFYREFFEACRAARDYFAGNLGQIIDFFIPNSFLEQHETLLKPKARTVGSSVFHIAPTVRAADKLFAELSKSHADNIFLIHGSLRKKTLFTRYTEILSHDAPVTVIMTPSFLFLPRHDVGNIVVHDEGNSAYRTIKRPYFDLRAFCRMFAQAMHVKLSFEQPESLETIIEHDTFVSKRDITRLQIIDMSDKELRYKKSFVFSRQAFETIQESQHAFLFSLKKGLGNSVICHDCGHILKDGDTPLALRERSGERALINPHTGATFDPKTRCSNCSGWNFDTLGIGTDTVVDEARNLFPQKEIFQIDGDTIKTDKKVREVIEKFYGSKNAVLVGTELAFSYLDQPLDTAVTISMDALLSLPSFRVHEKLLRLALAVGKLSDKPLLQTREPNTPAIAAAANGDIKTFFETEKSMRQKFGYPPFGTIMRLSRVSLKDDFDHVAAPLIAGLSDWQPFPRRLKRGKAYETIIIMKLPKQSWHESHQDPRLADILSSLGPDWQIKVNPDTL